jgi:hypothetical protein
MGARCTGGKKWGRKKHQQERQAKGARALTQQKSCHHSPYPAPGGYSDKKISYQLYPCFESKISLVINCHAAKKPFGD